MIVLVGLPNFGNGIVFVQMTFVVGALARQSDWEVSMGGEELLLELLVCAVWVVLGGRCLLR